MTRNNKNFIPRVNSASGKSTPRKAVMLTGSALRHSSLLLAMALSSGGAWATCTPSGLATISCTSPAADTGIITSGFAGDITGTLTNWQLNAGRFYLLSTGADATATLNANGVTATNGQGDGNGVLHVAGIALGSNSVLTVSNSSIQESILGHGVASHANNGTGNASATVTNSSIVMDAAAGAGGSIVVVASGSGSSTMIFDGGSVTAANTGAALQGNSQTGNVSITTRNGGTIATTGSGSHAIGAYTGGAGNIVLNNADTLKTSGANAHGIMASSTGTGNATVTNTGNITIDGAATAVRVDLSGSSNSGNATINLNGGDIKVNGVVTNGAVYAASTGAGNATINMTAGTVVNNSTHNNAHGLEAHAGGSGDSTVKLDAGSVTTYGGLGLAAWDNGTGTGNATVTTAVGTHIDALGTGTNAGGIFARGGSAAQGTSVKVNSQSVITANAVGIQVTSTNGGAVTVTQTGGSITSMADGIKVNSAGAIRVDNSGVIQTNGVGAAGIRATGSGVETTLVNNTGAITTLLGSSSGIRASATDGDIVVTNSNVISTQGLTGGATTGNNGIYANATGAGNVSITSSGNIDTQGADHSSGIYAVANSGNVEINARGNLHTNLNTGTGDSDGIVALSTSGNVKVTYNDANGTISMAGIMGDGIQVTQGASSTGNVEVNILAAKEINVGGVNAQGIYIGPGHGNVSVLDRATQMNIGTSTTTANNGIMVNRTGAGNISIDSSSNMIVNSLSGSPAIQAQGETGTIDVVARGNLTTAGG